MQTLDQRYSASAYEQVLTIQDDKDAKKYGAMAHKLPILIHTAGLVQALEFVRSRGKPIQVQLLEHLAQTLGYADGNTLQKAVREASLSEYIRLSRQALAALLWYKRFAQSILHVEATEALGEDETGQ